MTASSLLEQMLISSRPISWVNTAFPFAAGYVVTGGEINAYFWVATFYFLIPYNFLIYIVNDVYDYESDLKNPRKNSIEGGLLPPETHKFMLMGTALFNVVIIVWLLLTSAPISTIVLLVLVLGAISYSAPPLRLKERPILDSINSSIHFVGPLIFALVATGWHSSYLLSVMAFFLWGCASHAFGAVQDILPDRKANIASIATRFGAKVTVRISLVVYAASCLMVALLGWPAILVCLPLALYMLMVLPYINLADKNAHTANRGWKRFLLLNQLTGFTVTIILILSHFGFA